jgi:hypothetical protein
MSTQRNNNVVFMTVNAFKKAVGIDSIRVVRYDQGPKATNKLSVVDEDGNFYRCQQSIDQSKPLAFLLEKGASLDEACLVNTSGTGESPLTTQFEL